ncbi:TRAP-type C4-dicarboxylate transport system, large permease component [Marinobacterium lacunae]|uniref:TRAP transporter large permease protein n=1 Tax=Marinobacterium lacunae TaxID=1232683 RepID=A0A081FUR4_9GAMM|nr:TRAP transporter large permease subunit [Marinobacterium lacunae]KEA62269.1 TRAP-type C4-dicarboxylate transport system, large permease component [Marinobacterium lacunae]
MTAIFVWVFPILLLLAVPVAFAMIGASGIVLLLDGKSLAVIAQRLYTPTQSFPMLAIPFFILAGSLMMSGRFGEHLVNFAKLLVGRFKGGMCHVSVVGSVVFGGVSGSAVADASALGNALIPVQKQNGYPAGFAAAVNAASSTISVLIPPSIPLILYGLVSSTSIIDLFVAGIIPGILLGGGMLALTWFAALRRGFPAAGVEGGWKKWKTEIKHALPALLMPIFVIGTLRFGIATPTEVSVMAVAYGLLIGTLVYRDLNWAAIRAALLETGVMTGAVMAIIMASSIIQWVLTMEQVPQQLTLWVTGTLSEPWMVILAMNIIMLIVGTFLDLPAAMLLLGPLFTSIAISIGLDPVQLGLMMVVNLAIGLYTPPVGTTLYISSGIAKTSVGSVVKELMPFYLLALGVLALISYVPAMTIY